MGQMPQGRRRRPNTFVAEEPKNAEVDRGRENSKWPRINEEISIKKLLALYCSLRALSKTNSRH